MTQADIPQGEPQAPITFGPTVTILFTDIRGFTEYTEAHGDEATYRMLRHHNSLLKEQITLYGGQVVKTLGDSYMVSFDAARAAVTCAVAMQRSVHQYNRIQQGPRIEIGVGINTGEPVRHEDDFLGGAVNLASRICGAAEAGRILVSQTVRHVVGRMEGSEWIDRGYFEIRGLNEPQHLYEVDWSGVAAVRATRVAPPPMTARVSIEAHPPPHAAPSPLSVSGIERRRPWLLLAGTAAAVLLLVGVVGGLVSLVGRNPAPSGVGGPPSGQATGPPAGAPAAATSTLSPTPTSVPALMPSTGPTATLIPPPSPIPRPTATPRPTPTPAPDSATTPFDPDISGLWRSPQGLIDFVRTSVDRYTFVDFNASGVPLSEGTATQVGRTLVLRGTHVLIGPFSMELDILSNTFMQGVPFDTFGNPVGYIAFSR